MSGGATEQGGSPPSDRAISIHALKKSFTGPRPLREAMLAPFKRRRVAALAGVDLEAAWGEVLALVGPNGAGKTTLLKVLCTLVLPDGGEARLAGHEVTKDPGSVRRAVGLVLADERSFYWRLSGRHNLEFFAALHGIEPKEARRRVGALLERVELTEVGNAPFREYSTGMKQKLALCRGLLHRPRVLLLDEPTRGIDLAALRTLRAVLKEHVGAGGGALLASHDLAEIEALDCRIALLRAGRITGQGTITELKERLGVAETIEITVEEGDRDAGAVRLAKDPRVAGAAVDGERLVVRLASDAAVGDVVAAIHDLGGRVRAVRSRGAGLEAVLDAAGARK